MEKGLDKSTIEYLKRAREEHERLLLSAHPALVERLGAELTIKLLHARYSWKRDVYHVFRSDLDGVHEIIVIGPSDVMVIPAFSAEAAEWIKP